VIFIFDFALRFMGDAKILFLHGSEWVEVELSAKEQDANPVILEVAEAASRRFDALDFRVHPAARQ
jgi:hypothetical protein